jgi:hypothetical protein
LAGGIATGVGDARQRLWREVLLQDEAAFCGDLLHSEGALLPLDASSRRQIFTSCSPISFNHPLTRLIALRRTRQFVGYVSEESPVEGAGLEEEKSSCSKRAILALLSCSSFKRFSLSSASILSLSVSCSMS